MRSTRTLVCLTALALLAAPVLGSGVITNGIDTWTTTNDGSSYIDFAKEPIPAGFFCLGSEPFTGRIAWQGKPLVSVPADALGQADTIVQRLDDALFDQHGVATTRLQVRALSLQSIEPIRTSCGPFHVTAALHGVQPMTTMEIRREKAGSGTFEATLSMNVQLSFAPARAVKTGLRGQHALFSVGNSRTLTLDHQMQLLTPKSAWQSTQPKANLAGQIGGFVLIDTDNDGTADTYVPGQSAFHPRGSRVDPKFTLIEEGVYTCDDTPFGAVCHPAGATDEFGNLKCHCAFP